MLSVSLKQLNASITTLSRAALTALLALLCSHVFVAHAAAQESPSAPNAVVTNNESMRRSRRNQNRLLRRDSVRRENPARNGNQARALVRRLNLTPLQISRLREIRRASAGERQALALRLREARQALDDAVFSDAADEALIKRYARRVGELQAELTRLRALNELKVRRLLTPEQLQNLRELREQARRSRGQIAPDANDEEELP